ncbi:MAG: hypothetical protein ABSH15_07025 [Verrucomicrobiota bacterium]|jgi:uncharacterized protein YggT (Ycf19 family)
MALIDFILNLAGLLLWLNWRSVRFDPLGRRTPATLIGTLRRAEPRRLRRWHLLAALGGLLLLRAGIYWQIGSAANWAGKLDLGITALSFSSNLSGPMLSFLRMLLFSIFSFGLMLGVFYLWLLLLSILAGPEPLPFHRLVRMPLGGMDRWARGVKFLLPLMVTASLWWLASWLLAWLQVIPEPVSLAHRIEESLVIGLGSYLTWKYLIGVLLALHLLNSYIYFGKHPFWSYVNAGAQALLSPLRAVPLRAGKVDFAPVVGIALVFLAAELAGRGLVLLYGKLPF